MSVLKNTKSLSQEPLQGSERIAAFPLQESLQLPTGFGDAQLVAQQRPSRGALRTGGQTGGRVATRRRVTLAYPTATGRDRARCSLSMVSPVTRCPRTSAIIWSVTSRTVTTRCRAAASGSRTGAT